MLISLNFNISERIYKMIFNFQEFDNAKSKKLSNKELDLYFYKSFIELGLPYKFVKLIISN